jgi:plastocyanin
MRISHVIAAAALALGAPVAIAQPAAPTVIAVQLSNFHFSPATIELTRGQPYVLRLTNAGGGGHSLKAKDFFQTVSLGADSAGKVHEGDVEVPGQETVDLALTPNQAGSFEMHCGHTLHATMGMRGQIVVH